MFSDTRARALLAIAALLAACTTSPTGRKQLRLVPESQMTQLGNQAFAQMMQQAKVSGDARLTEDVRQIVRRLGRAADVEGKLQVRLIESDEVNAFALPGGHVGIYTGMLEVARTNAGLAAIIGHEIGHLQAHHSSERLSQQLAADVGLTAVDQFLLEGSKYRRPAMAALGLGTQVGVLLPYSRTHEREADELGLEYMARAGYDPAEAVKLWQRMAKQPGGRPPEFLSTHPDPAARAKRLRGMMSEAKKIYQRADKVPTRVLKNQQGEPVAVSRTR